MAATHEVQEDTLVANLLFRAQLPTITLTAAPGVKNAYAWVSGHVIGKPHAEYRGPRYQVPGMIVGKCLGGDEVRNRRLFTGSSGQRLLGFLQDAGLEDFDSVYVTNLIKTTPLVPKTWKQAWVDQQAFLLDMEIALTRPRFVMSLGAEATKYFLKKSVSVSSVEGQWFDCVMDLRQSADEEETPENMHRYRVIPCTHPASLDYEQKQETVERISRVSRQFVSALQSGKIKVEKSHTYPVVRSASELQHLFDRIRQEHTLRLVAVDAEWQGGHPQNAGAYLRCVQLGWGPGKAATIQLTNPQGEPAFVGPDGGCGRAQSQWALDQIAAFFDGGFRVAGHFFQADLEWLIYHGCDLSQAFAAAAAPELAREQGGFAVEAAVHAYDELADMSLDSVTARFTDMPTYKRILQKYRKEEREKVSKLANKKKLPPEERAAAKARLEQIDAGFGWIPDEVLYPYAAGDVDATIRAALRMISLLDGDRFNNNCWLPYWRNHRASLVAAEIMQEGLPINPKRLAELSLAYGKVFDRMLGNLQRAIRWKNFSVDNWYHVIEFLYGKRYSASKDKSTGRRKSVRPCGALTINAEPVLTNEDSPRFWSVVREKGEEAICSPGTNGKTIGVLYNNPDGLAVRRYNWEERRFEVKRIKPPKSLMLIRDLRTIRQVQKTFVGKAVKITPQADGTLHFEFDGGLGPTICGDGRIRCFISQVKETGRWSASRPNLHAMPKRKESRYKDICGEEYPGSIRTIFEAPEGHLFIEADYSSAELFMLSIAADDDVLWEDCRRSLLDESHPDYLDPHSNMAVEALRLPCVPTKTGLKSIGKGYLRDVAKCVAAGELLNTSSGLVPVEWFAEGLGEGEVRRLDAGIACQSDRGTTPLLAIENTGQKECVRVRTQLGYELICTPEHRCYVLRSSGEIAFVAPKDFLPGDQFLLAPRLANDDAAAILPPAVAKALALYSDREESPTAQTPAEAELLGLLAAVNAYGQAVIDKQRVLLRTPNRWQGAFVSAICRRLGELGVESECFVHRSSDGHALATGGVGLMALLKATAKSDWLGVPELVLMWPEAMRAAFLRGFIAATSQGSLARPVVVIRNDADESRRLHQLLLSVGVLSRREQRASGADLLHAIDATGLDFFRSALNPQLGPVWVTTVRDRKLPYLDKRLNKLLVELGRAPTVGNAKMQTRRRAIFEKLNSIDHASHLTDAQRRYVQQVRDLLQSQLVADPIAAVEPVGLRQTYDVETTPNRRHLVLFGGICTHNSVVYGWCYGRQPPAIVLGAAEEGVIIQLADAEAIFKRLGDRYNKGQSYLRAAAERVQVGCLCTPLGRWRRFPESTDRKTLAGYQREAMNSPIQGGVADLVNDAAYYLHAIRQERSMRFRIALQVHDAFLFAVPYDEVVDVCNYVIPEAMVRRNGIVPYRLDGTMTQREPKRLGFGLNVYKRWGESLTLEQISKYGIDSSQIERLE